MAVPSEEYTNEVIQWVTEQASEARSFLQDQYGYGDIEKTIDYIQGEQSTSIKSPKLSDFNLNRLNKIKMDLVASLTDLKPIGSFRSNNPKMQAQAEIINKLSVGWWLNNFVDLKVAAAIEMAIPAGCSYLQLTWNPRLHGGLGDLDIIPRDARDVLPLRPSTSISIQDCMGVIIHTIETVHTLQQAYPHLRDRIKADQDFAYSPSGMGTKGMFARAYNKVMSPVHAILSGTDRPKGSMKVPGKEIFTAYIYDTQLNSGGTKKMGYGSNGEEYSWSYVAEPGEPLYPRGRVIVCSRDMVFYDGPNPYLHGKIPLVKIPMDMSFVLPDSFLSRSPLADLVPVQDVVNEIMNGIVDAIRKALNPGVIADKRFVSRAVLEAINTREPGMKLLGNPVAGEGLKLTEPPLLPSYIFDGIKFLLQDMEYVSGSVDMTNLAKVKQIPAADSIESLQMAMTPSTRLRGRILESVMRELAEMCKYMFLQFYDAPRRIAILGPDGLSFEDFDFDPNTLVPSGLPGNRTQRALIHANNFSFYVTPNSMLEIASTRAKMLYLQLRRQGDMDLVSLLEMLEVPNVPQVLERLQAELQMKAQLAAQAAAAESEAKGETASTTGLQKETRGRKPTAQTPPHLEQKGDGRVTVAES